METLDGGEEGPELVLVPPGDDPDAFTRFFQEYIKDTLGQAILQFTEDRSSDFYSFASDNMHLIDHDHAEFDIVSIVCDDQVTVPGRQLCEGEELPAPYLCYIQGNEGERGGGDHCPSSAGGVCLHSSLGRIFSAGVSFELKQVEE